MKTTKQVIEAITALQLALEQEYGCDYAYQISGNGHILGASNTKDGTIYPVPEAEEQS